MLYLHLYLSQCFYFYIYYSRVILNWKHDRRNLAFEASPLPLEWRRRLNAQIELECSWVRVKRRVQQDSGDGRGGRRKRFDVTRRPPTWRVDLAANTGVTPLNHAENTRLSRLHLSLAISSSSLIRLSRSLISVTAPPPTPTPPHHNLGLSLSHSPPQSRQLRLN